MVDLICGCGLVGFGVLLLGCFLICWLFRSYLIWYVVVNSVGLVFLFYLWWFGCFIVAIGLFGCVISCLLG